MLENHWLSTAILNDAPKHGFKFSDEELRLYFTQNFNDYLNGVPG